ncbi:DUF6468 domain-containing protein [Cohaesibacter celericrescens]|jgi:hypothetical protein|uniref:Chemotaxis protein n=1 Tax=Cohaesibacter celericrescens TaxID=2067669 RepID=A0A2N5XWH8_9HYPH|nr:DUF6468 domain-containing protein [Cohaesibacter celericrescens]PLW78839.1 chemotaxis protein [Cohaesibacter celericrescens]
MTVGMMIELLVAFLLVLTIGYCMTLNKRLKRLRNDEEALRATIAELITATEIAERAILGLKATAGDCDKNLTHRLMEAERLSSDLQYYVSQGDGVVGRLVKISDAVRGAAPKRQSVGRQAIERDYNYEVSDAHYPPVDAPYPDYERSVSAPVVESVEGPRRLKDVAAATSERLMAIRQKRGVAA